MQTKHESNERETASNAVVYFIAVIVVAGLLMLYKFFFS